MNLRALAAERLASGRHFRYRVATVLASLAAALMSGPPASALPATFLKANRCDLRDHAGTGDPVYLRGVNLGGWLFFEGWMCPGTLNGASGGGPWQEDIETNLIARFGVATKDSLIDTYQSAWITAPELDLVAAAGMNLVRLPFTFSVFQEQPYDPSVPLNQIAWKSDTAAFKHLDWLVTECARRRIYVVFDFHHPEGGASATGLYGHQGYQDRFVEIWRRIAAHYAGNPTVLGYDLVNESGSASNLNDVWNRAYQAIRSVDPDHVIVAEYWSIAGTAQVMDTYGWQNVVASMHDYWTNGATVYAELMAARAAGPGTTVCPYFVGEFMDSADSTPRIRYYSDAGASWCSWTLKSVNQMDWSMLNAVNNGASSATDIPNLNTNSAAEISARWARWTTRNPASRYQPTCNRISSPVAVDDLFSVPPDSPFAFTAQSLLANDTDLSQLSQLTVTNIPARTAHGIITAAANGYLYQPDPDFVGTDTFTYRALDQRLHLPSAYPATVTLQVVGPATQLIWTTQPGLATNGAPFGQQPVLQTADQAGNPTTNGLPATLILTVAQSAGAGPLLGATNFNIGTSGSNGLVSFSNLQINSAGANNQLTASVPPAPPTSRLANGDFNSPASTAAPTGWSPWTFGAGYANHELITPAASVRGNYDGSYEMTCGAANTSGGGGVYQIIPVTAGMSYSLGVDAGVQNWWLPMGQIRLFFLDAANAQLALTQINTTDSLHNPDRYDVGVAYQRWSLSAVAPASATQAKVEFAGYGGGSCWFDNAVLTESNSLPALASATTLPFTVYPPSSQTNYITGITANGHGTFMLHFVGTTGVPYCLQTATNLAPPVCWEEVAGSATTVTNLSGAWLYIVTNAGPRRFYRSAVVSP